MSVAAYGAISTYRLVRQQTEPKTPDHPVPIDSLFLNDDTMSIQCHRLFLSPTFVVVNVAVPASKQK